MCAGVGHEEDADPAAVQLKKHVLRERSESLSKRGTEPGVPVDLADAPLGSPEVVVERTDGSGSYGAAPTDGDEFKDDTLSNRLAIAASSAPAREGGVIHVKSSPRVHDSSVDGKKKLVRRHSSRFSTLSIPGPEVSMFSRHFQALFIKRWINAKRDRKVWTWTLLYPFLILLIGCGLITLTNKTSHPILDISSAGLKQNVGLMNHIPVVGSTDSTPGLFSTAAGGNSAAWDNSIVFDSVPPSVLPPPSTLNSSNTLSTAALMNAFLLDQVHPAPLQPFSRYNAFTYDSRVDPSITPLGSGLIDRFVVYFNTSAQFASALGLNTYNNAMYQQLNAAAGRGGGGSIKVSMHPMPQTQNQQTLTNSLTAVIVAIGFAFMPANFISFAVKEEQDKVKHQQLISGVSAFSYWGANYAWDFCNYMVMGLLCLLIFKIWGIDQLVGANTGGTFLAIVLYGLAVIPFNYLCSFAFTESTSAQNSMLLFYIFAGALLLIAMLVLGIIESTKHIAYHLKFVCRLIPSYAFGECIANIIIREVQKKEYTASKPTRDTGCMHRRSRAWFTHSIASSLFNSIKRNT